MLYPAGSCSVGTNAVGAELPEMHSKRNGRRRSNGVNASRFVSNASTEAPPDAQVKLIASECDSEEDAEASCAEVLHYEHRVNDKMLANFQENRNMSAVLPRTFAAASTQFVQLAGAQDEVASSSGGVPPSDVELDDEFMMQVASSGESDLGLDLEHHVLQSYGLPCEPVGFAASHASSGAMIDLSEEVPAARQFVIQFKRLLQRQRLDAAAAPFTLALTEENLSRHDASWRARGVLHAYLGDGGAPLLNNAEGLVQFRVAAQAMPIIEAMSVVLGADVAELVARFVGSSMEQDCAATLSSKEAPNGERVRGLQTVHRAGQNWDGALEIESYDELATISTPCETRDGASSVGFSRVTFRPS